MSVKNIVLTLSFSTLTIQTPRFVGEVQNSLRYPTSVVAIANMNKDVEKVASQILACPAWSEADRANIKVKNKIMDCLALISRNEIATIREAITLLFSKYPSDSAVWSRVFLLNRYLFQVPNKSLIDENLFGGWVGVPVENGQVNRLWPFSQDSQNNLQLVGEFEGYFGSGYRGIDEFDYFQSKFGLRKK